MGDGRRGQEMCLGRRFVLGLVGWDRGTRPNDGGKAVLEDLGCGTWEGTGGSRDPVAGSAVGR
jgi:hypothetical protein